MLIISGACDKQRVANYLVFLSALMQGLSILWLIKVDEEEQLTW